MLKTMLYGKQKKMIFSIYSYLSDYENVDITVYNPETYLESSEDLQDFDSIIITNYSDNETIIDDILQINKESSSISPIIIIDDSIKIEDVVEFGVVAVLPTSTDSKEFSKHFDALENMKFLLNNWRKTYINQIRVKNQELFEVNCRLIDELIIRKEIEKKMRDNNRLLEETNRISNFLEKIDHDEQAYSHSKNPTFQITNSNEIYKMIVENSNDLMYVSSNNKMIFTNKTLLNKTGYSKNEIKELNSYDLIHPDDRAIVKRYVTEAKHNELVKFETRILKKNNEIMYCQFFSKKVLLAGAEVHFGVAHDITNQKKYETHLKSAKLDAEQIARTKMNFLAQISHELRTPLNAMLGFSQLLQMKEHDEKKMYQLEQISKSGQVLLKIINDLIQISFIDSGKLIASKKTHIVSHILNSIKDIYSAKCMLENLKFDYSNENPLPEYINTDSKLLFDIIEKLMSNAIKYTKKGKISMHVKYKNGTLLFQIIDTGIGIPKEKVSTIFDIFNQLSSDFTRNYEGTGLGLSIVKRLVKLLGGTVDVESTINVGSKFTISLPTEEVEL